MNIFILGGGTFPSGMAGTKRVYCYAKGLKQEGNNVMVLNYQRVYDLGSDVVDCCEGIYKGIGYRYISGLCKSKNKFVRYLDWNFVDAIRGFIYILNNCNRGDVLHIYVYQNWAQCLFLIAALIKNVKISKETCEHPSSLAPINIANRISRWFEYNFIMPCYDCFIPISFALDQFVKRYKCKTAKSLIVPILVDENADIDFSKHKSPYDVPYIIHTGTMHEQKDSISKILNGFARYKRESGSQCKLVFTGPHANERCQYISQIKELGLEHDIELLGMVSMEQVQILQHFASLTIIYKSENLQTRNCFPTKLGEMLIAGVPVITTKVGDANLYLKNEESAYIIDEDDEDSLVSYISYILQNPQEAKRVAENGREVALLHFNPLVQGKRMSNLFKSLYR